MAIAHSFVQERILAAQGGDLTAFGDVVEHLHGVIRGYVAMHGAPAHEEEELAQRAFIEAYQKLGDFDPGRPFLPWMRGIARYVVLRYLSGRDRGSPPRRAGAPPPRREHAGAGRGR